MLELDLTFRRGGFTLGIDGTIDAPVTGLFGRSGSGKSTLLHLIAGLLRPDEGRIALAGRTLVDRASGVWVPPQHRRIGLVFQDLRLLPHRSVRSNLVYGHRRRGPGDGAPRPDQVIDLLELRPLLRRRPSELSGGEAQRVAVGRALLAGPSLLLLDEPLTGLDASLKAQILPFLVRVRDAMDVPVVYVTHQLEELLQLTDRLLVLEAGRVAASGRYVDLAIEGHVDASLRAGGLTNVLRLVPDPDGRPTIASPDGPGLAVRLAAAADASPPSAAAIRPEDIALASETLAATSIRNQLRARVLRCATRDDVVLVEVDVGQPLLVSITPEAARELDVRPGREVRCLIKSTAIRPLAGSPPDRA